MRTLKYRDLIGVLYESHSYTDSLIIIAIWVPNIEDIESMRNAQILVSSGYNVFVPEYYWFCRSRWDFSPENSLQTCIDSHDIFSYGYDIYDIYSHEKIEIRYANILFLWLSYGGSIVSLLPKFRKDIKKIGLFYPVLEYIWLWKIWYTEESGNDFLALLDTEFRYLYRWIDKKQWSRHFSHETDMIPIQENNIKELAWVDIFMAHGRVDDSLSYSRTQKYAETLQSYYPDQRITLKLYDWLGHGYSTLIPATYDFIDWIDAW